LILDTVDDSEIKQAPVELGSEHQHHLSNILETSQVVIAWESTSIPSQDAGLQPARWGEAFTAGIAWEPKPLPAIP